jgi:hypothetical protein
MERANAFGTFCRQKPLKLSYLQTWFARIMNSFWEKERRLAMSFRKNRKVQI